VKENKEEPLFRVVDLEGDEDNAQEGDDFMYFLAKVKGKHLVDPFLNDQNIQFDSDSSSNNPYEKDSQDSNKESAKQKD